jgi:hypothetical protein
VVRPDMEEKSGSFSENSFGITYHFASSYVAYEGAVINLDIAT